MSSSPYRWVVLALAFLVNATIQMVWVSYAPVTIAAAEFYRVGQTAVGMFSMLFMIAFIPFSLPASWLIDRIGVRRAVGAASLLVGLGAVLRGMAGDAYGWALAATVLPAIAQPVLLNAWTATVHPWFAEGARTTAVSLITLGNLIGTAVGLVLTPELATSASLPAIQLGYGLVASVAAVLYLLLARDHPAGTETVIDAEVREPLRVVVGDSLRLLTRRDLAILLAVSVIAFGTFNGITTWVEPIVAPKGLGSDEAGLFGALMLLGGLVGAIVVSGWCDKTGRRATALTICLVGAAIAMLGVAVTTGVVPQFVAAVALGFFLVACLPVAIEYATELAAPTSPAVANGLVQLFGQASVVLVFAVGALAELLGTFLPALYLGVLALLVGAAGARLVAHGPRRTCGAA